MARWERGESLMKLSLNQAVMQVQELAEEHGLWEPEGRIVVAVSGGPDSVALLHILSCIGSSTTTPLKLVVAHVNHGFRPEESASEAEFVRLLARQYNAPFEYAEVDAPAYMTKNRVGAQEAARELRYQFLHEVAVKHGAVSIALVHHADDQAETVLLRLLRGSGISGLSGMRMKRKEKKLELIRPLLRMYKTDLLAICEEVGLSFVTDSSNLSNKYVRNAIRWDVLPFLGQYNGQLVASLNKLSVLLEGEDDYMSQAAAGAMEEYVALDDSGLHRLDIASLAGLHVALQRRLIKLILTYLPLSTEESDFAKVEAVRVGALQEHPTTWHIDLGGGAVCRREYNELVFWSRKEELEGFNYEVVKLPAVVPIPGTGRVLSIRLHSVVTELMPSKPEGVNEAWFDADKLIWPITVRSRLPGDVMRIIGLSGSKKVKDIFIDEKIPPSERGLIPIIANAKGEILWIAGVRRSDLALITHHHKNLVVISWESAGG